MHFFKINVQSLNSRCLWCRCHAIFIRFLNQIRAKVGVVGIHVNFTVSGSRSKRDDVTRFQVKNTSCIRGNLVNFSRPRGLSHGHVFAVHSNIDPSIILIEDLQIDIVPSTGRHSQFSIMVLHPSSKMAVRGTDRPVFYHYEVNIKKTDVNLGDFH